LRELAFSVRSLRRSPVLFATAVLTLAIGLGVSTGVLAVAYALLLRPLPFEDPSTLVVISVHPETDPLMDVGVPLEEVAEWKARTRAFATVSGSSRAEFTARGAGDPRSVRVAMVADDFFATLGVTPREGGTASIHGGRPSAALSATLADDLDRIGGWRARGLFLGDRHFGIAAVLPPAFTFPSDVIGAWVPAGAVAGIKLFTEDDRRFRMFARLRPGVSLAQAQDDVARVAIEQNSRRTQRNRLAATVRRFDDALRDDTRKALVPFLAGAVLVLVVACANVSGLLVGRASAISRDVAVRRALGGNTRQLLRAGIADGLSIALCGWVLSLILSYLVIQAFITLGSQAIANLATVQLGTDVVAGSLMLALIVGIASAAPATIRVLRTDPGTLLKGGHDRTTRQGARIRSVLVVSQIALTLVLLVCAGLLTRTVINIIRPGPGFRVEQGLATRIMLADTVRYRVTDRADHLDRLLAEVRRIPGVLSAGVGSDLPPRGSQVEMTLRLEGDGGQSEIFPLSFSAVTPGYLESLGVHLLAGRLFEDADRVAPVPRVVISRSAARKVFEDRDPVGREWMVSIPTPSGNVRPTVVGVVDDIKTDGLDRDAGATIFAGWETFAPSQAYLVIRSSGDPLALAVAVRGTLQRLEPTLPVYTPETLEEVVAGSLAERRLRLGLAATFAALALLLAIVALSGAVAQGVVERRRELAIRMALGSTGAGAVRLVLRGAVLLVGAGIAVGTLAAAVSARALEHLLLGVSPLDPLTFGAAAAVAAVMSLLAGYAPARRAARISPAELLREG
jgi:putative ABC transport system permease protein